MEARKRPTNEPQDSSRDTTLASSKNPLLEDGRASGDGSHSDKDHSGSVRDEWRSIALLLFLYVLQGIPPRSWISRATVAPEQACQLQGASPVQLCDMAVQREASYAIGLSFFWLSSHVRFLLGDEEGISDAEPNVLLLTVIFLSLNFLAATQDIAVDGWALTMLSRRHVGYASTCNSVGQTAGYFLGNVVFLALESADFCNRYLRSEPQKDGIVTLDGFLYFWGIVFMVTTTLVALFKHERDKSATDEDDGHPDLGIAQTYKMALRIFHLPSVRTFCIFLFTCKVGFGVADSVTGLKLLEAGLHRENLALLAIPMVPIQIMLPLLISKHTGGHRPLDVFFKAYPYRLLLGLVFMILLHWTYHVKNPDGTFPLYYYAIIVIVYAVHQVTVYSIFVSLMAFHARATGPQRSRCGWWRVSPSRTVLALPKAGSRVRPRKIWIHVPAKGGTCETTIDGYNIEMVLCIVLGFAWLLYARRRARWLQSLPQSAWKCT
ncbi:hypothetical protein MRX96_028678 [Rhipicephalus microplus]